MKIEVKVITMIGDTLNFWRCRRLPENGHGGARGKGFHVRQYRQDQAQGPLVLGVCTQQTSRYVYPEVNIGIDPSDDHVRL